MPTSNLLAAYLPIDRRLAIVDNRQLPEWCEGAVLVADVRGFTALGEELARRLGPGHGAEELNRQVSACFGDLIGAIQLYHGAVIHFSGDALLACFCESDPSSVERSTEGKLPAPLARATAAAAAIQQAMQRHPSLNLRIGLGMGTLRRRLLGAPEYGLHDLASGPALDEALAAIEEANPGAVAGPRWEGTPASACPWPERAWNPLPREVLRAWVPVEIYNRLANGAAAFVAELRQVVPLFLQVEVPDEKLADYVAQAQSLLNTFGARLNGVEVLDKGTVLVALFGAPVTWGDDAVRAVKAALTLRAEARAAGWVTSLRAGLSMGPLYAGLVGSTARLAYTVYGDEMNVAARLMAAAGPWEVLASARVRWATEARYRFTLLQPLAVKGRAQQVSLARLEGEEETQQERGPLVGRREEQSRLEAVIEQVWRTGAGAATMISGEAGIGKSRLAAALQERWKAHGGRTLMGQAQALAQQQPYQVWGEVLRQLLGLGTGGLEEERLREALAAVDARLLPRLPLLGDVLGLSLADTSLTRSLDARLRQASTQALVATLLQMQKEPLLVMLEDVHWLGRPSWEMVVAVARSLARRPVLLALTSRPLDPAPPALNQLQSLPGYQELVLGGFSPEEAAELACQRLGVSALPEALATFMQGHGQGNPFFIEEILHTLEEEHFLWCGGETVVVDRPLDQARLPDTVQGVVLARIDRLDEPVRLTLKVAAVIGRVFSYPVLRAVHPNLVASGATSEGAQDAALRGQIERLRSFDIVLMEGGQEAGSYLFKHAITHEVAYGTLLFSQRQSLHGRIAHYYEAHYAGQLEPYYALLAHHYGRADQPPRWAYYLDRLAAQSWHQYASDTAIGAYRQLLSLLEKWARGEATTRAAYVAALGELAPEWGTARAAATDPEDRLNTARAAATDPEDRLNTARTAATDPEDRLNTARTAATDPEDRLNTARAQTLLSLANVLDQAGRRAEQKTALEQALALAQGKEALLAEVQLALAWYMLHISDYEGALTAAREARENARRTGNRPAEAGSVNLQGAVLQRQGRSGEALEFHHEALELCDEPEARGGILRHIGNAHFHLAEHAQALDYWQQARDVYRQVGNYRGEIQISGNIVLLQWNCGRYEQAMEQLQQSLAMARQIGDRRDELILLSNIGDLYRYMGCYQEAVDYLQQCLPLADEIDDTRQKGEILNNLGRAYLEQGRLSEARDCLQQALQIRQALEERSAVVLDRSFLGRTCAQLGELAEALEHSRQAAELLHQPDVVVDWEQEVHYNHYQVCRAAGLEEEAQEALEQAYRALQALADGMTPEDRRSFLEDVRVNQVIQEEWKSRGHRNPSD